MQKIVTVRFKDPILVGRSMEVVTSLADGMNIEGHDIELEWYNDMFFKLVFPASHRKPLGYHQMIPWSNVATALIEEEENEKAAVDHLIGLQMAEPAAPKKRGRPAKAQ